MNARLTLVCAAKGGLGRSMLASNLAVAFARRSKRPAALIDLDWMGGGSLASYLDLDPSGHWGSVLSGEQGLADAISQHESGVALLAAPPATDGLTPTPRQLADLMLSLAKATDTLVVDTTYPSLGHEAMVALFDMATQVVIVTAPDITAISGTKALLEQSRAMRYPPERLHVVLNRVGLQKDITPQDVTDHLEKTLMAQIPEHEEVVGSLNRGVPILTQGTSHPVSAGIIQTAGRLLAQPPSDLAGAAQAIASRREAAPAPVPESAAEPTTVTALVPRRVEPDARLAASKRDVHKLLVEELKRFNLSLEFLSDPKRKGEIRSQVLETVAGIVDSLNDLPIKSRADREQFINDLTDEAIGFGPLERYLADPLTTEVMVNGPSQIYVERAGKLSLVPERFTDERQLRVVIDRIVAPLGRRVDESSPMCDARLPDGSRVNVIIPPLSLKGSTITIRKFPHQRLGVESLVGFGTLSPEMAHFLKCAVLARLNIFISGGTGSGKTTLLNVLSGFIPPDERIVTIEDAAELKLHQDHVISLESRPANLEGSGAIHIRDLVRNSLRMRPDRIIVGEVRGGEALDMLQAMNTGHDGSLATGHANTPRDALARLETMVLMAGVDLPSRAIREQIASAINLIVQVSRLRDGARKIVKIAEVTGMEGDRIVMQDLYTFDQTGIDEHGRVMGGFRHTGLVPNAAEDFERVGLRFGGA